MLLIQKLTIDPDLGFDLVFLIHCVHERLKSGWPFQFLKDSIDGCEANHVKGFFLVKENDSTFLILGINEVYEELNIYDVLSSILCGDESTLVVAYPFGKNRAHPVGPNSHNYFVVIVEKGDGAEFMC